MLSSVAEHHVPSIDLAALGKILHFKTEANTHNFVWSVFSLIAEIRVCKKRIPLFTGNFTIIKYSRKNFVVHTVAIITDRI